VNGLLTRAALAAGSLALLGGLTAAASPAAAADHITFRAFASAASGDLVTAGPVGAVTGSPAATSLLSQASIPPVLSTGQAFGSAGLTGAYSRVSAVHAVITWTIAQSHTVTVGVAEARASCSETSPAFVGTSLDGGVLDVDGTLTHLPQHPAPGTSIPIVVTDGGLTTRVGRLLLGSPLAGFPAGLAAFTLTINTVGFTQSVVVASVSCFGPI
jgi:hypothetical protein